VKEGTELKKFLLKLGKESMVAFVTFGGATLLATPDSFGKAAAIAAVGAGFRAVVGVVIRDFAEVDPGDAPASK
jgi:hypothetical protein